MKMLETAESSDISSVTGRLVLEWQGSACDGFITSQRIVNRMGSKRGDGFVSDFRVSSWEAGDGSEFTFSLIHYMNGAAIEEIEGSANRGAEGGDAALSKPQARKIALPAGVLFPTEQLRAVIASAESGKRVHSAPVFDGSDTEHHFDTTTVLGNKASGGPDGIEAEPGGSLSSMTYWPVQVSYFDPNDSIGLPEYEVSFHIYENGVSTSLVMDYGDLVIGADLVSLDMLPSPDC